MNQIEYTWKAFVDPDELYEYYQPFFIPVDDLTDTCFTALQNIKQIWI